MGVYMYFIQRAQHSWACNVMVCPCLSRWIHAGFEENLLIQKNSELIITKPRSNQNILL